MQNMKAKHLEEIEAELNRHAKDVNRVEDKRLNMAKLYDAEIANYLKVIEQKDRRITVLKDTIKKALNMMR